MALEFVWPLFGDGPLFSEMASNVETSCKKYWWKNVLMIGNYIEGPSDMCIRHGWYLSAEFQLFVLGILTLSIMKLHEKLGILLGFIFILIGMVVPGYQAFFYGYDPAILATHTDPSVGATFIVKMYLPAHNHLTFYFMGLLVAYGLQTGKITEQGIKKYRKTLLFFLFGMLVDVYFPGYWNTFDFPVDPISAGLYSLLNRFIFIMGFLALFFCSKDFYVGILIALGISRRKTEDNNGTNNNNGNAVKKEPPTSKALKLISKVFKRSAKLYFSLYLIHPVMLRYDWFTSRSLFNFDSYTNVSLFVSKNH